MKTKFYHKNGFTMVEILTVIGIMVVLMAMSFGIGNWAMNNAKLEKCKAQVALMDNAIQQYEADQGEFPPGDGSSRSSIELYNYLYENPLQTERKVYMPDFDPKHSNQFKRKIKKDGLVLDPFRHKKPYFYWRGVDEDGVQTGSTFNPDFDLWSLGPDGKGRGNSGAEKESTEDDVTNWR